MLAPDTGGNGPLGLEANAGDIGFNATLVVALGNLEKAAVTPLLVPAVLDPPVILAVHGAPANHLNSVTAESLARNMLVHTALVRGKVGVDGESDGEGAVLLDGRLHAGNRVEAKGTGALVLVRRVRDVEALVGALVLARHTVLVTGARRVLGARGHMVRARLEAVSLAELVGSANVVKVSTADDTGVAHPVEGSAGLATVASHGHATQEALAAPSSVHGRKLFILAGGNAAAVLKGLGGAKRPAAAARRLVADLGDDSAVGPGRARIEVGGALLERLEVLVALGKLRVDVLRVTLKKGTEGLFDVFVRSKAVNGLLGHPPVSRVRVHKSNNIGEVGLGRGSGGGGHKGAHSNKGEHVGEVVLVNGAMP
eukprot:m.477864 g.477864  ORF g.477864 m.477864 type:complete len:369 (-) comp20972_c0_seq1:1569-2675(-)